MGKSTVIWQKKVDTEKGSQRADIKARKNKDMVYETVSWPMLLSWKISQHKAVDFLSINLGRVII